jgi:hypothetical protein
VREIFVAREAELTDLKFPIALPIDFLRDNVSLDNTNHFDL